MLLYFALDDEDTCFHSSKIFNNLEDLYKELMDYRENVHFVYSVTLFVYDTDEDKGCTIVIMSDDIGVVSYNYIKSCVDIFIDNYYRDGNELISIRCSVIGDECGNFGYDFKTLTYDNESEVRL